MDEELFYCGFCNLNFCAASWKSQAVHKPGHHTATGVPHEQVDVADAEKILGCLKQTASETELGALHDKDETSCWFGINIDHINHGSPVFEDFGRFATLVAESSTGKFAVRYPGLISFIGETGAGKSSLVRLLIELNNHLNKDLDMPIVGAKETTLPTSGDVHLYSDPATEDEKYPLYYVDSEGLSGGNSEPMGARSRRDRSTFPKSGDASFQARVRRLHQNAKRSVKWATSTKFGCREYAVEQLYPRLLYTFSDAVVFVATNARTMEKAIELLVNYAEASFERSSNMPILPHLIIALNAAPSAVLDDDYWDVLETTKQILEKDITLDALRKNPKLSPRLTSWQKRGKTIASPKALLLSYYHDVKIVRIPFYDRPKLVQTQVRKLYQEIHKAAEASRMQKLRARMLLSAEDLQPYLHSAFDHFCRTLDQSFDFVKVAAGKNRLPNDFAGNVVRLAVNVMNVSSALGIESALDRLSAFTASCILLDSVRRRILGLSRVVFQEYLNVCDDALNDLCDHYMPCAFKCEQGRCVNMKFRHKKGPCPSSSASISTDPFDRPPNGRCHRNRWSVRGRGRTE